MTQNWAEGRKGQENEKRNKLKIRKNSVLKLKIQRLG